VSGRSTTVRIKRAYEPASDDDGLRILVDRLWPRGLTKEAARIDVWLKDIAPSPALRTWFGHDPARWDEFRHRYEAELRERPDAVAELRRLVADGPATLVHAGRDRAHTHALVLLRVCGGEGLRAES
jgi:uncharacterized protein YeaO (DUF488 family)